MNSCELAKLAKIRLFALESQKLIRVTLEFQSVKETFAKNFNAKRVLKLDSEIRDYVSSSCS